MAKGAVPNNILIYLAIILYEDFCRYTNSIFTLFPNENNLLSYFVVEYHSKSRVNRHFPRKLPIGRQQHDCITEFIRL